MITGPPKAAKAPVMPIFNVPALTVVVRVGVGERRMRHSPRQGQDAGVLMLLAVKVALPPPLVVRSSAATDTTLPVKSLRRVS